MTSSFTSDQDEVSFFNAPSFIGDEKASYRYSHDDKNVG